ncbi:MAG: discoidin domain-containing protein, partial [Sphingobacteriales bacterium]
DNAGRLAFLLGNMGTATVYIDDVVIKEIAYIGSGDPLVKAIDATNFVSASTGWETEWWGLAQRAVDGATGNKASGNDGESEGKDLWISVKIDPEYEVKEVLVAGDKSAPRSLAQFKVEYGPNTMINWTNSNGDGVFETFNTFSSAPPVSTRDFKISFRPPAGQLVEVSDVQFMAVDYKPYRIYTMGLDNGGTISPSGTLRFSKNNTDSQTYTFTPPSGRAVANVIVDGVSQGAVNSYTFSNINKSHTLAVAYTGSGSVASSSSSSSIVSSTPNTGSSSSAAVTGVLVSQGRTATTNSQVQPASNAVDGNTGTRWESTAGVSPSWLMVDLGSAQNLTSVVINWEAANAGSYQIQGTNNGVSWTTLKTVTGGTFGARTDTHTVSGSYRYVRVNATERSVGNQWGYSIYEFKVYA